MSVMHQVGAEQSGGYLGESLMGACHVSESSRLNFFFIERYMNGKLQMDSSFVKCSVFTLLTTKNRRETP